MRKRKNLGKRILAAALALVVTATTVVDGRVPLRAEEAKEFTVWFNNDGQTNVDAGQYKDYPIYLGEAMSVRTNKIEVDNEIHYSVQGKNNPKKGGTNPNGAIPDSGAYLKVVAPGDGLITVYGYPAPSKPFYATKGDKAFLTDGSAFDNATNSYTVEVKAGEDWYFYAQGSKALFIGVKYELPKADVTMNVRTEGVDLGDAKISFTSVTTGTAVEFQKGDSSVMLKKGESYKVSINSGSLVIDKEELDLSQNIPEELVINISEAPKHEVSGELKNLPQKAVVEKLVFTDANGAKTEVAVSENKYSVSLKNGDYTTSAEITNAEKYSVYDHIRVEGLNGETIKNDVWFYEEAPVYGNEYKEVLQVGKNCEYKTISEAVRAVKAMTRTDSQRVTLVLQDSEYVEQVIVDTDNISLVAAEGVKPVVRWYYGIGYKYYSIDTNGFYNEKCKNDKYEMHYAQRWGAVVRVTKNGFYAENVTFENTFNRYVCDEELGDSAVGSAVEYGQSISGSLESRVKGLDVANTTNVERAAAIALDGDSAELYKCNFISSQDTVYTGSKRAYFNECTLVGQTDYIFGNEGCSAIFDNCELKWLGYTGTNSKAGYITATRGKYVFRGCKVVNSKEEGYTVTPGYFGRPWGTATEVAFIGTEIEENSICEDAWASMSGVNPSDVIFREYGNTMKEKNFYSEFAKTEKENKFKLTGDEAEKLANPENDASYLADMKTVHKITKALDFSKVKGWENVTEDKEEKKASVNIFDASEIPVFAAGAKQDEDSEKAGTDKYFTLLYSVKTKVEKNSKVFSDDYEGTVRLNFGGTASTSKNAIKFTTTGKATVKIWWGAGDVNRPMSIRDEEGNEVVATKDELAKNAICVSKMELNDAGTYYLGGFSGNNYIFKVEVTELGGAELPARADWSTVESPVITKASCAQGIITVDVKADVSHNGGDQLVVVMMDQNGKEVAKKVSTAEKGEHSLTFVPDASNDYTFVARLTRDKEEDKVSEAKKFQGFVLPLTTPVIKTVTSTGNGSVAVTWSAVKEAVEYKVVCGDKEVTTSKLEAALSGLPIGETVTVSVCALRGNDVSAAGTAEVKVTSDAKRVWGYSAYGSSASKEKNGYEGNLAEDGKVTIFSKGNGGKIVPASSDGIGFYYTVINPKKENFTLRAKIHINTWKFTNGQEGFGLLAADAIGTHGDTAAFWNNSFAILGTKTEYYTDGKEVTTNQSDAKISMYNGLAYLGRTGVTPEGLNGMNVQQTLPKGFVSEMGTLETSCLTKGTGSYNIFANCENTDPGKDVENLLSDIVLEIQRDNTGYHLRYLDAKGNVLSEKLFYDLDRTALTQLDKDHIYLGFFAAREMNITVSDVELTTIDPSKDASAEERQYDYVDLNAGVESAAVSNSSLYNMLFYGNADGTLTIKRKDGKVIADAVKVSANEKISYEVYLALGNTDFVWEFTPDADYEPAPYTRLKSYEKVTGTHSVRYDKLSGVNIYVSPDGKANGKGTKGSPLDIYTAVKYVQPGQKIVLMGDTYKLSSTVKVERGINGFEDKKIYMIADPENTDRPVLDFQGKCAGMILAGDYWYFEGFDVTGSANAQKGIQVSGSHNTLDAIRAYKNGNTGIQISRYLSSDTREYWPSYNLILNCTSFLNADRGYEDADGFAAKLTVGEGNVFDGCIAAYNADDGWDLFAKAQTGCIGSVTIQNCVAFKNGYVLDEVGNDVNAGNGNGFKMGGESLSGKHVLKNSIAFANKAKGIDSNSCPDIRVFNSTSFNNESYNVAFYTNNAKNTDFEAAGIISYKNMENAIAEQFKFKGNQDESKVKNPTNFFVEASKVSKNSKGLAIDPSWFESANADSVIYDAVNEMFDGSFGLVKGETVARVLSFGITRDASGVIQMHGFLKLTSEARQIVGENVGADITAETATPSVVAKEILKLGTEEAVEEKVSTGNDDQILPPKEGEARTVTMWIALILAGLVLLGSTLVIRKKK